MAVLEGLLLELGGKALAKVIGKKFGDDMGGLAKDALDALGQAFGAEPEPAAIEKRIDEVRAESDQRARGAVAYAEAQLTPKLLDYAEVLRAANEQQRMTNELLLAQAEQGFWASAWLWVWQWFLMFAWGWTLFLVHILNAAIRIFGGAAAVALPVPDLGILVTLTGLYLGLHMGGHTVLELMRGGTFERKDKA